MNRAPKDKKVGLMATALTGMVQQRITMDARKAQMEDAMMKHMMQHMQMGKESMSQCPMMKSMKDMDENPVGAHKEQLPGATMLRDERLRRLCGGQMKSPYCPRSRS